MNRPIFSIGVTTFDRKIMLRQCLASICSQTLEEFEVIIGNDNPARTVNEEFIECPDQRCRIYNYEENCGEIASLNFLLEKSQGQYFTWIADDDAIHPRFLENAYKAMQRHDHPQVVFTDYISGDTVPPDFPDGIDTGYSLSGKDFLYDYLCGKIELQGTAGVFRREFLLEIGGARQLGTGFSPYSDVLLAIESSKAETIAYIPQKLYFMRTHSGSASFASTDISSYTTAQLDLINRVSEPLAQLGSDNRYRKALAALVERLIRDRVVVKRRKSPNRKVGGRGKFFSHHAASLLSKTRLRGSIRLWLSIMFRDLGRLGHGIYLDIYHHVLPWLLRRQKPGGTGLTIILPRSISKIHSQGKGK